MSSDNIFWEGWRLGLAAENPFLLTDLDNIEKEEDKLKDQLTALGKRRRKIVNMMPSWASQAMDGSLSVRCYAYYWAKQKNITVEEATKILMENFKPQKKSDPLF